MTLHALLPYGISVFSLDFAGAGHSEGDFISLGYYEQDDVDCGVKYLVGLGWVTRIGLWGHSMGASTCLMYAARLGRPYVCGMVLDSAFTSLPRVMMDIATSPRSKLSAVPDMFLQLAISFIRSAIRKRAKFDIRDVSPLATLGGCTVPALYVHGDDDDIVAPHHSDTLFAKYAGTKSLYKLAGHHHNSIRSIDFLDTVSAFFCAVLCAGPSSEGPFSPLYVEPSMAPPPPPVEDPSLLNAWGLGSSMLSLLKAVTGESDEKEKDTMKCFTSGQLGPDGSSRCHHTGDSAESLSALMSICYNCNGKHAAGGEGEASDEESSDEEGVTDHSALQAAISAAELRAREAEPASPNEDEAGSVLCARLEPTADADADAIIAGLCEPPTVDHVCGDVEQSRRLHEQTRDALGHLASLSMATNKPLFGDGAVQRPSTAPAHGRRPDRPTGSFSMLEAEEPEG